MAPKPDYAADERAALQALKRNWGLKPIIIATLLALGFAAVWAAWPAFQPAGEKPRLLPSLSDTHRTYGPMWGLPAAETPVFLPGRSDTHQTYGPMKDNERKALPGPTTPQRYIGDHEVEAGPNEIRKMEQARQELERLPKGKIVLDAPKAMKVGDMRAVYANVGINVPIELLRRHSRPTDQSHEAFLSVSREMGASLTGPGFSITPTAHERQGVAEGFPTVWSWNVEAKQEGEQELEATLYVLLPVGDKSTRQRIDSYTHKIGVSIKEQSWAEWLKSSKEEVEAVHVIAITLASAVMAMLGWLGLSYSRRRQIDNLT
jgi:hypothetical protein